MPRKAPYGFSRGNFTLSLPLASGFGITTAANIMLSYAPGFSFVIEKVTVANTVAAAGSGATRTLNIRKGSASGTVVATKAIVLADCGLATVVDVPVTAANATYNDTDTLTVDLGGSGTVFTTFEANLIIQYRVQPQRAA
jgi:hypothetical protein